MALRVTTPADRLTAARMFALPVLWLLAALELPLYLGIGIGLAGLTDVLDGPVARRTGQLSRFGGQLDSLADMLLLGSILAWLVWLRPGFLSENAAPLLGWVALGTVNLLVTLIKFRRLGNLHLYSAKAAGFLGYIFVMWLFMTGDYHPTFFAVVLGVAYVGAGESLVVALTRDRVDERIGSIFHRR